MRGSNKACCKGTVDEGIKWIQAYKSGGGCPLTRAIFRFGQIKCSRRPSYLSTRASNGFDGKIEVVWIIEEGSETNVEGHVPLPCSLVFCVQNEGINPNVLSGMRHLENGSG